MNEKTTGAYTILFEEFKYEAEPINVYLRPDFRVTDSERAAITVSSDVFPGVSIYNKTSFLHLSQVYFE